MNTKIVNCEELNNEIIIEAGQIIKDGGLVAFPTETVYGLGGDALNPESSKKIYAAKGRPSDNPLIVHIAKLQDIEKIVTDFNDTAKKLAQVFWPGPLTMILDKADTVPVETTGGLSTVAVRFPSHKIARDFIEAAGGYVAAPSANISGRPSPTLAKYVCEDMNGRIEMILDGGDIECGLESTIVDTTSNPPMILRPGFITREMLETVVGEVSVDPTIMDGNSKERPKAPGMRYRHYAPKANMTIVEGEGCVTKINELVETNYSANTKICIIATDENVDKYTDKAIIKSAGSKDNDAQIASSIYRILRECDDEDIDLIYSEGFEGDGIRAAIMNRLLKAAGHNVLST